MSYQPASQPASKPASQPASDNVSKVNSQKHLSVVFDNHLSFDEHLKMIKNKVNKAIGLLRKLQKSIRRFHQLIVV